MTSYQIPVGTHRIELPVSNSRFIATVGHAESVDAAKQFLASVREEMPDASHHVYAFRVGYGNSVTEGMSDDGEPSGTAGPPVLSVLRGTQIGDVVIVVTRYFGGTKLGTGGLVRAYSQAARDALSTLPVEEKIEKQLVGIECPYPLYEQIKRLIIQHEGMLDDEQFTTQVAILATFRVERLPQFADDLRELSAGQVEPVVMD